MTTAPKPRPIRLDADGRKRLRASIAQWNRRAPALRWRSEPPDVVGGYWARARGDTPTTCHVTRWKLDQIAAHPQDYATHEWAGPISEPEEGGK